jgi:hypothetical protein
MKVFGWILIGIGTALSALLVFIWVEAVVGHGAAAKNARFLDIRPAEASGWQEVEFPPAERQLLSTSHFSGGGKWDPGAYETGWVEIEVLDREGRTFLQKRDWVGSVSRVEPIPFASIHDPMEGPAVLRARVITPTPVSHEGIFRIHVNRVDPLERPTFASFLSYLWLWIAFALILLSIGVAVLKRARTVNALPRPEVG